LKDRGIKIREKIEKELETLDLDELSILYEQIKLIARKNPILENVPLIQ